MLPLILEENKKIKIERKTLFSILNKNSNSQEERNWLRSKFKQYGVVNRDLTTLKIRMDEIPVSLAIAQAAKKLGKDAIYNEFSKRAENYKNVLGGVHV